MICVERHRDELGLHFQFNSYSDHSISYRQSHSFDKQTRVDKSQSLVHLDGPNAKWFSSALHQRRVKLICFITRATGGRFLFYNLQIC